MSPGRCNGWVLRFLAGALLAIAGPPHALAQIPPAQPPQGPAALELPLPDRLEGRLYLADVPADSGTVVLHQVNPESAGAIDSVRVDGEGRFAFDLTEAPTVGGGQTLFVSHRRYGILYHGPPLFQPEQVSEPYEVRAYGTREAPPGGVGFPIEIRNIIIEEGPGAWRVTDILQLHNDDDVTWVAAAEGGVVWRYPLPPEATAFRLMEGGTGGEDIRLAEGGMLLLTGAVLPGDRLLVFQYDLPSMETVIPLPGRTDAVEFLVREPSPPLRVEGLRAEAPVEMERGSVYRRWWATEVEDRVVRVTIGEEPRLPTAWVSFGVALVLVILGAVLIHRTGGGGPEREGGRGDGGGAGVAGR